MILSKSVAPWLIPVIALAWPVPLRADVMEVGSGTYRWIAGTPAGTAQSVMPLSGQPLADLEENIAAPAKVPIPDRYIAKVAELSHRYDLSPALIEALVWQESRWRSAAVSPAGARGLAQLMPGTARDLGVDPDVPEANLEGGARYLRAQLDRFGGDLEKALAAYNAGPKRVADANGVPRIRETQNYVASIIGRLADYSRR